MKKIIFITAILLLLVSCTVTKQKKSENQSHQQQVENSTQSADLDKTTQTTKPQENKSETSNNTNFSTALSQKKKDSDYNPYQHQREEYIKTGEEFFEGFKKVDCDNEETQKFIDDAIDGYNNGKYTGTAFGEISNYLGKMYCPEIIAFFEEVVKKDTSEAVRCDAIQKLGWLRATSSVPVLMEQLSKNISDYEKACIGSCLTVIGEWDLAETVLNSACFCKDYGIIRMDDHDIRSKCMWSYYIIGNESSIKFFNSWFEQEEGFLKVSIAVILAELGEYEKTYPIFIEAIHSDIPNYVYESIRGLAVIGTEEALRLIEIQTQNKNEIIAKEAQGVIGNFKRRKK